MKPMLMAIPLHDLTFSWRRHGNLVGGVVFYAITASLFPLATGPDPQQLRVLASGILRIIALLASTLSPSRLFAQEHTDGNLDQLLLPPHLPTLIVLTKIATYWLVSGLPLLLLMPILAQQYSLPLHATLLLTVTLLIGAPIIALIGAVGAALTLGMHNGAALLCILVLPLYASVLVFGAGAGSATDVGLDVTSRLLLLDAYLALSLFVCPLVTAAGLRIVVE